MTKLSGWLLYRKADAERNRHYIPFYEEGFKKRGRAIKLMFLEDFSFLEQEGKTLLCYHGEPARLPDFVVMRADAPDFSFRLEALGIPVFNSAAFSLMANDKARTLQIAAAAGIPTMKTVVATHETAESLAKEMGFPLVMKPRDGHGGQDVLWLATKEELKQILPAYHHESFLLQEPASELGKDLRVYVIGGKIVAAMLRSRKDDFRSNYCLGGEASLYPLEGQELALVKRVVSLFSADYAGFDFMFHRGTMVLNEIEDVVGARMLYNLTEIDVVDLYIEHIVAKIEKASSIPFSVLP